MNSNHRCLLQGLVAAYLCCLLQIGFAQDSELPVEITSDTAEYDEKNATVTYTGNVLVIQGRSRLNSARLTLHQPENGPQMIIAEGSPVRFHQPADEDSKEINGSAKRAEYDLDNRTLTLIGEAEVIQETDRVTSDRILYDMASATVKAGGAASGSGRVRTVIQPRK